MRRRRKYRARRIPNRVPYKPGNKRSKASDINYGILPIKRNGTHIGRMSLIRQDGEFLFTAIKKGRKIFEGQAKTAGKAREIAGDVLTFAREK